MGTHHEHDELLRESNPNASGPDRASGGMGVSSEREGAGPLAGQTDGTRDTSLPTEAPDPATEPPEQRPGHPEENPEGIPPKAGYSAVDPRDDDEV